MDKQTIDEMRVDCACEKQDYCPLEEVLLHINSSERLFIQHKCIEKFKSITSKKAGRDIGWKSAYMLWVDNGMAVKFAEIYKQGMKFKEICDKLKDYLIEK